MKYSFSVIIPVLYESSIINSVIYNIYKISSGRNIEVIVVDGSPGGDTLSVIKDHRAVKLASQKGRGGQMNTGAAAARGDILIFLHADTVFSERAFDRIESVMNNSEIVAGAFNLKIDSKNILLDIISDIANLRSRLTSIPYGDQSIFVKKNYFNRIGGYIELPIMEDVNLMSRIKKNGGKIYIIPAPVRTSARKWKKNGIVYTTLKNRVVMMLYYLGVSPHRLVGL